MSALGLRFMKYLLISCVPYLFGYKIGGEGLGIPMQNSQKI